MGFLSGIVSRFFMSLVNKFWQSHTDRELGKTKAHNENLEESNKELNRHAEIDSNVMSIDDAYSNLGLSDGNIDGHGDRISKVPESKSGSIINIKGPTKPSS